MKPQGVDVCSFSKIDTASQGGIQTTLKAVPLLQEMQDMVAACLQKDPAKRPTAEQLLKHRFFKWVKHPRDALDELLNGVPGPVQRLSSLTRRSTENILAAGDEMASYQPDERVSLKSQKVSTRGA